MPRTLEELELILKSHESEFADLKNELAEVRQACEAILQAMQSTENHLDEKFMPEGEYLGVKFED